MALTINLTQLKRKKKKDGTISIYIRITEDRKSRYKSTSISVLPKYWNADRQEIRKSHRRNKHLNRKLRGKVREIQKNRDELEKNDKLNLDTLKSTISEDTDLQSILYYAMKYRQHLNDEDRYWERRHFKVVIGNIEKFIKTGKRVTALTKVDAEWIEDFQDLRLISRYETGKTAPSIDVAIALAKALNVSLDWLTDLDYSLFVDDAELTNLLKNYDQLDPDDQATIKKILKAFSIYSKIEHTQQQLVGQ